MAPSGRSKRSDDADTSRRPAPAAVAAPAGPAAPLRVATFNIRNGRAWDSVHSWPFRRAALASAVAALDADVIGLQEVYRFQRRSLLRRLPGYAGAGAPRNDGRRRGEACPILYRSARLRLERHLTRWLSDTPDVPGSRGWGNAQPRIATLCWFADSADGRRFGVVNTHWDGASAGSRARAAGALLGWLEPGMPWLVLGDLNATTDDPAIRRLLAGGLRDPLAELGAGGVGAATHHHFDGATTGTRIDFVLVGEGWQILAASIDHARPGGRLASDHWPVVATVGLT